MAADDRARTGRSSRDLATALLRFAAARPAAAPSGTLGVVAHGNVSVMARVNRLLEPEPMSRPARVAAMAAVPVIAVLPLLLMVMPH